MCGSDHIKRVADSITDGEFHKVAAQQKAVGVRSKQWNHVFEHFSQIKVLTLIQGSKK